MFDLQKSIDDWHKQMLAAGVQSPVPLEDLELHLREEIERLRESGLDESSAFSTAVQNLGPVETLREEFEKVILEANLARSRRRWLAFEILFFAYALLFPVVLGIMAFVVSNGVFSEMTFGEKSGSLASAVMFSLFAFGMRFICLKYPGRFTKRIRDALFFTVLLWLLVLAYVVMPHSNFADGARSVVSMWGLSPFGLLIGWLLAFSRTNRMGSLRKSTS